MGTRFIHVDIKHGYNPIMIFYARRLISQTCCASTVSTVGGCILSCRPLSSEDISLLMIKFLVFPIATTQDVVGVCLNRIGKVECFARGASKPGRLQALGKRFESAD